ncbi:unnamed protein product, partial [Meganyctiphanes norvegica]
SLCGATRAALLAQLYTCSGDTYSLILKYTMVDFCTDEQKTSLRKGDVCRKERRFHSRSSLALESIRLETFVSWPITYIKATQLAKNGFYYTRVLDHVRCYVCDGIIGYWEEGDDPKEEHRKHFPNCDFVQNKVTGNIPQERSENETGPLYEFLESYYYFKISNTKPSKPPSQYQTDSCSIADPENILFPQLRYKKDRLQTFASWPRIISVSTEVLAESGFFSLQFSDWVQCFHCGGGLFNWMSGDDPIQDHCHYYPHCDFIREKCGEEKITEKRKSMSNMSRTVAISQKESQMLLYHPIAQRLVDMGLSKSSVCGALQQHLEERGQLPFTLQDTIRVVFDYDEKQQAQEAKPQTNTDTVIEAV